MNVELKIKDLTFIIIFSDPLNEKRSDYLETDCGETFFNESKIFINSTMNDDLVYRTIKHELTHAYLWVYGFTGYKYDEESICNFVESYADEIIMNSKMLFKEYVDERIERK